MALSIDIPVTAYALAGLSLLLTVIFTLWIATSSRALKRCASPQGGVIGEASELPAVSVIVYSQNSASQLRENLPYILNQDYPCMEVIVVNDGKADAVNQVVAGLKPYHSNLRATFVPPESRNLSRKKLAIMVGIKAAAHDVIITTADNCRPTSPRWIEMMARNFVPGVEVVIGQSSYNVAADHGLGRWYRLFGSLSTRMLYLSYAGRRRPYRGTSDNIAYLKGKFFANKGFSSSVNLHYGDDDIFVNEITNRHNTRVEISPESIVSAQLGDVAKALNDDRLHHDFTSGYVKSSAFALSRAMAAVYYIDFLAIVALGVLNCSSAIAVGAAVLLLLLLVVPQMLIFRRNCGILHEPRLTLLVPCFTLLRPLVSLRFSLKGRRYRAANFTWQDLDG